MDPYRCDCGAELDHPGADCDACGARGTDTPERDDDRAINELARASEAATFTTMVQATVASCRQQLAASGTTSPSWALVKRHAIHHLRRDGAGDPPPRTLWEPVADAAFVELHHPQDAA